MILLVHKNYINISNEQRIRIKDSHTFDVPDFTNLKLSIIRGDLKKVFLEF